MNTPTLRSAVARQRWDVVAHLLLYGLIAAQTNGHRPPAGSTGSDVARQPSPKRAARPRGA
jgi:hypothetical protein